MAIKKVCDICGKESPNEKGKYVANNWLDVVVSGRGFPITRIELLICNQCASGDKSIIQIVCDNIREEFVNSLKIWK